MYKKSVAVIAPVVFAAVFAVSTSASAKQQVTLSGTFSRGQVKKDCDAVGGTFSDTHSYGYGCLANNGNIVNCDNRGKCTGSIPRRGNPPHTIGGILHSPSAGITSFAGDAAVKARQKPVNITGFKPQWGLKTMGGGQPVTSMRTEPRHSGGGHK